MERDLSRYLERLDATIRSHRSFEIEALSILDRSKVGGLSEFRARLRYWDNSLLIVEEALTIRHFNIVKTRYVYHYKQADGTLIFRYDSATHHPELPTFPHHKHVGDRVEPATPPDLSDVLRKIDAFVYASAEEF